MKGRIWETCCFRRGIISRDLIIESSTSSIFHRQEATLDGAYAFKQRIEESSAEYALLVSEAEIIHQNITESAINVDKAEKCWIRLVRNVFDGLEIWKSVIASAHKVWGEYVFEVAFISYSCPLYYINRINLAVLGPKIFLNLDFHLIKICMLQNTLQVHHYEVFGLLVVFRPMYQVLKIMPFYGVLLDSLSWLTRRVIVLNFCSTF